jgi:hypothetical protein
MTPQNSLHKITTPQGAYDQAKLFGITDENAKQMRLAHLKEQIKDFETRIKTALSLWWSETNPVGQELLENRVLIPHWKVLYSLQNELEQWQKPIKQYKAQQDSIDWVKASLYPCTDLLGNPSKKMGKEWLYHAPNREDKNPSFAINIEKNIWHDWGTGEGGNVFDLYILLNGGTKIQACKALLGL